MRDFGEKDVVTVMRLVDNSPMAQRAALKEGSRLLNLSERLSEGSVVSDGTYQGLLYNNPDYSDMKNWQDSFKNVRGMQVEKTLNQEYQPVPAAEELRWRTFILDPRNDTYKMHIPSSLLVSGIRRDDPRYGVLEAQLEKHNDLPRNVSELDEFCNPKDPSWIDNEGKFAWLNGKAIINFGKYKGKTFEFVSQNDSSYFQWIIRGDFSAEVKDIANNAINGKFPEKLNC